MNSMVLLLALTVPTVNYGWRPGADGQLEYIVQLEAESLAALREGKEISSDLHPEARGARNFILRFGTEQVPRISAPLDRQARSAPRAALAEHAVFMMGTGTVQHGWQAGADGRLEYLLQLDEGALEALEAGEEIAGKVHAEVPNVDRLVVRYGQDPLPRANVVPTSSATAATGGGPRSAHAALQVEPQYRNEAAAPAGRYAPSAAPSATPSAAMPADSRTARGATAENPYRDPYASPAAGRAAETGNGYGATRYEAAPPAGNRYATNPAGSNPAGSNPATAGTDRNTVSPPASPTLLQPPAGGPGGWETQHDDPDDAATIARADQWDPAGELGPTGTWDNPAREDRWAEAPNVGSEYPQRDWRQPPYGATTGAASGNYAGGNYEGGNYEGGNYGGGNYGGGNYGGESPRVASGNRAGEAPMFSRPAARTSASQADPAAAPGPARVAQDSLARESIPRTARASSEEPYETSPSSSSAASRLPAGTRPEDDPNTLLKELVLFASLGINVVAVLIARQYYLRYRMLIREMRDPETIVA